MYYSRPAWKGRVLYLKLRMYDVDSGRPVWAGRRRLNVIVPIAKASRCNGWNIQLYRAMRRRQGVGKMGRLHKVQPESTSYTITWEKDIGIFIAQSKHLRTKRIRCRRIRWDSPS